MGNIFNVMRYHPLQRVDEVLQVDVISVRSDVLQEEIINPLSDLALKDHSQHGCRQLEEEDQANDTWKLTEKSTELTCATFFNLTINLIRWFLTYKLEQADVFSQSSHTASETQDEGDSTDHQDQPYGVKTMQPGHLGEVREDSL